MARGPKKMRGVASEDAFDKGIVVALEFAASGALRWTVSPYGEPTPVLKADVVEKRFEANAKARTEFESFLSRDVAIGLEAILNNEDYGNLLKRPLGPSDETLDVPDDLLKKRLLRIQECFYSERLKERVIVRRTSKMSLLSGITWQIAVKKHDGEQNYNPGISFATVRFDVVDQAPESRVLATLFGRTGHPLVIDLHEDDIDLLIEDLERLRTALREQ